MSASTTAHTFSPLTRHSNLSRHRRRATLAAFALPSPAAPTSGSHTSRLAQPRLSLDAKDAALVAALADQRRADCASADAGKLAKAKGLLRRLFGTAPPPQPTAAAPAPAPVATADWVAEAEAILFKPAFALHIGADSPIAHTEAVPIDFQFRLHRPSVPHAFAFDSHDGDGVDLPRSISPAHSSWHSAMRRPSSELMLWEGEDLLLPVSVGCSRVASSASVSSAGSAKEARRGRSRKPVFDPSHLAPPSATVLARRRANSSRTSQNSARWLARPSTGHEGGRGRAAVRAAAVQEVAMARSESGTGSGLVAGVDFPMESGASSVGGKELRRSLSVLSFGRSGGEAGLGEAMEEKWIEVSARM